MSKACESHRVLVFRDNQVVAGRIVHCVFVVDIRILAHGLYFALELLAVLIDGHKLLVQVIEACACRFQPVLESGHITHVAVTSVQVSNRLDGKRDECAVLGNAQCAR